MYILCPDSPLKALKALEMKIAGFAKSLEPDEVANTEPQIYATCFLIFEFLKITQLG